MADSVRNVAGRSRVISAAKLRVEWFRRCEDIPESLWHASFPAHLEGRFWYWALEKSGLEDQFQFFYGLISCDGEPIGIAPAFLMDVPMELVAPEWFARLLKIGGRVFPSLPYQRTFFVGSVCADEGTIGLIAGISLDDVLAPLQSAVEEKAAQLKAPVISWKDFPDSYRAALAPVCARYGMWELPSYPGTIVDLASGESGSSTAGASVHAKKEAFLSALKGSRRHNFLKKLKRSKKAVALEATVEARPDAEALKELFGLFWQTYERGKTKFESLNLKFFELMAEQPETYFVLLRKQDDRRMVAFMLCFKLGERVINKFIGIDYNTPPDWYLYFRLWEAALDWVLTTDATEFQGGQTGYRAKIDVGHSLVPLTNYCKHRNSLINFVYRKLSEDVSWATLDNDLRVYLSAHPVDEGSKSR